MKKGFCITDRQWECWTAEELDAIIDLQPEVIQVNIYEQQPPEVRDWQRLRLWNLFDTLDCDFEYRMYGWRNMASCAQFANSLTHYPDGAIIPFNEPNEPIEGWTQDPELWQRVAKAFAENYQGGRELITPAMSPNYPLHYEGLAAMTELVRQGTYRYLGIHTYSPGDVLIASSLPVCVTECHGPTVTEVFDRLAQYKNIEEAVWFSLHWNNPAEPNYQFNLLDNPDLYRQFKEWKGEVSMPLETAWQAWVVQKVVNGERDFLNREAFITHLEKVFGVVTPKPEEYGFPDVMASGLRWAVDSKLVAIQKLVGETLELLQ